MVRVFLTGGSGFIGSRVAERLRVEGHDVIALVRSPARATALVGLGCELLEGHLDNRIDIDRGTENCDAVIHCAGRWEVGVLKEECPKMEDTNIGGVRRVLDSAIAAGVKRVVHVSTVNVFGNTAGAVVDETFERDATKGFMSCYDSSKYSAHQLAKSRITKGAPVVIVQPGVVYGPGDHSEIGREILLAAQGRLGILMLADIGISMSYVDDLAMGIVSALEKGRIGESYVLGGENLRLREVLQKAAHIAGKKPPTLEVPTSLLKLLAPIGRFIGPRFGYPPNLTELIRVADKNTYWATSAKAQKELSYVSRPLEEGLRETLKSSGISVR